MYTFAIPECCTAGGEPPYNCPAENTANIAFCLQTGADDTMYGRSRITAKAKSAWDNLEKEHPGFYIHKIDLQPGLGHGCDYTVTTPWLKNHVRNPLPKYVYWENFGLGNVNGESFNCRSGFYNLHVIEGQIGKTDGATRDVYEMSIDGNTVTLNVMTVVNTPTESVSENGWTMNTNVTKTYTPATRGKVKIYFCDGLIDLSEPVTVIVNDITVFNSAVQPDRRVMVESIAEFFDPCRVFPAAVEVSIQ